MYHDADENGRRDNDETLKDGVEQILMEEVPGVLEVQNISSSL